MRLMQIINLQVCSQELKDNLTFWLYGKSQGITNVISIYMNIWIKFEGSPVITKLYIVKILTDVNLMVTLEKSHHSQLDSSSKDHDWFYIIPIDQTCLEILHI